MLTSHGFNKIPTWAETLIKGNVSGGTSPKLSNGDRLEAVNGNSYFDPRHNGIDSQGRLHSQEALVVSTGFRKPMVIGMETSSNNAPVFSLANSTYQTVQINNVNLRGTLSLGNIAQNPSSILIPIGTEYQFIVWGNMVIYQQDNTNGGQSIQTKSNKFNITDQQSRAIGSIESLNLNQTRRLSLGIESLTPTENTINEIKGELLLQHKYYNKQQGDIAGTSITKDFLITQNRISTDGGLNYTNSSVDFVHDGNIAIKIFEDGNLESNNIGINSNPNTLINLLVKDTVSNSSISKIASLTDSSDLVRFEVFNNGVIQMNDKLYHSSTNSMVFGKAIINLNINETTYGYRAGNNNTRNNTTFIGTDSGLNNGGGETTAVGALAAKNNTGNNVSSFGYRSGDGNTAISLTSFGYSSGLNNTGDRTTVMGFGTGNGNQGINLSAFGNAAANSNTGGSVTAFGGESARANSGSVVTTFGINSGRDNTGSHCDFFGEQAGRNNTANNVTAIGRLAGVSNGKANSFIISSNNLPSYVDKVTATTDLTTANGCVSGNVYIYYNESNDSIEGVKIP